MNSHPPPPLIAPTPRGTRIAWRQLFLVGLVAAILCCTLYIASFFHLEADAHALSASALKSLDGQADQRLVLHVGSLTMSLVHDIGRLVDLQPEPRAILDSIRGAEVGIYGLGAHRGSVRLASTLAAADRAMRKRGWICVVGVVEDGNLVAVYVPDRPLSPGRVRCCVMVLNEQNLVIASATGNLQPLTAIAQAYFNPEEIKRPAPELTRR